MGRELGERLIADDIPIADDIHKQHIHIPSSGFTAISAMQYVKQAAICCTKQEKFRIAMLFTHAALQFIRGIDVLDQDTQDKEHTEGTEEANNVGSSYYRHQCDQLVTAAMVVNMTSPLCQGCFREECDGVNLMQLAKPSESQPAASDSDVKCAMEIPSSDQTVLDIVNGSALNSSRSHSYVSPDNNGYSETNLAQGHEDSNRGESPLLSDGSDHAVTSNVPGHVAIDVASSVTEHPPSLGTNVGPDQPNAWTSIPLSDWIFSATGFVFEAVSAYFDQVSTPQKPHYAFYGMLLSIVAVLVCVLDLILNAMKQRNERGITSESNILLGILPEIFGLALAYIQCISSALQFSYLCRHASNPVKVSLVPFLFFFVLFAFKYRNGSN